MRLRAACGDDANGAIAQRVDNTKDAAIDHAGDHIAVFAVVLAVIEALDGKRIAESSARRFEGYAMVGIVLRGLGIIPFKFIVVQL
jgi:hypothetical protein